MSHKAIYMSIPASKHKGNITSETISNIVEDVMKQYLVDTAEDESNVQLDYYHIGGRFSGLLAVKKETLDNLIVPNNEFGYELFNEFDALFCNGNHGPYFLNGEEYVPANGAFVEDIVWDIPAKYDKYYEYLILNLLMEKDPRFKNVDVLENGVIEEDGIYFNDEEHTCFIRRDESFDEFYEKYGYAFGYPTEGIDAFIDNDGIWHDENEIWKKLQNKVIEAAKKEMAFEKVFDGSEIEPSKQFTKNIEEFIGNLSLDDYFLVIDGHSIGL